MNITPALWPFILAILVAFAIQWGFRNFRFDRSALVSRLTLFATGAVFAAIGVMFFLVTVRDPPRYLYLGFILGPMVALAGLYALIVAIFFPVDNVRATIKHYFKMNFDS